MKVPGLVSHVQGQSVAQCEHNGYRIMNANNFNALTPRSRAHGRAWPLAARIDADAAIG